MRGGELLRCAAAAGRFGVGGLAEDFFAVATRAGAFFFAVDAVVFFPGAVPAAFFLAAVFFAVAVPAAVFFAGAFFAAARAVFFFAGAAFAFFRAATAFFFAPDLPALVLAPVFAAFFLLLAAAPEALLRLFFEAPPDPLPACLKVALPQRSPEMFAVRRGVPQGL